MAEGAPEICSKWRSSIGGESKVVNPVYRFGAQQSDKLRAKGDLKRSLTDGASAVHTPINLASWDRSAQICYLFRFRVEKRPLGMPEAGHADANKQIPLKMGDELSAAARLLNPRDSMCCGFFLERGFLDPPQPFLTIALCRKSSLHYPAGIRRFRVQDTSTIPVLWLPNRSLRRR